MKAISSQGSGPARAARQIAGQVAARVIAWVALLTPAGLVGLAAGAVLAQNDGPDRLSENFRDWVVNCETFAADAATNPGERLCEMVQQIDHQESGQRVLAFSLRINDAGDPVAVLVAPFGLRLSEGLRVRISGEQVAQFGFETCLPEGCLVIAPMEANLVAQMQSGTDGSVVMVSRQGEALGIPISLMGFTAGLERLRALSSG